MGVRHVSQLSHPNLVISPNQVPCRQRELHIVEGVCGSERTLCINDPDIQTLACALLERMFFCKVDGEFVEPPLVSREHVFATLREFRACLLMVTHTSPRISPEQFVEMYVGRKRTIYENNLPEFYETGVLRKHALSCAFVKCEKVPSNKAPRCIQPRHPVYNIGLGTYLKHNEHKIYRGIARVFNEVTVVKGYNVQQVATILENKWNKYGSPVAVGLDATKFDMHVSREMLEWEHSIYRSLFPKDKEIARLLEMQLDNVGVGRCDDGKLKYKVRGRRFSGDMNTALGNCLIMCAMVYSYLKERGIKASLMNNGDDCQVIMEERDLPRFLPGLDEWFMQLGFRMTVEEPCYSLAQVEFCQMRLVHTVVGPVMVRNIPRALEKDSMSIIPLTTVGAWEKWIYAVGECGMALCQGVPIMQSLYQCYLRHGKPSNIGNSVAMETGARMLARGIKWAEREVTPEARADVFEAWGITPDEQVALEEYYRGLALSPNRVPRGELIEVHLAPL